MRPKKIRNYTHSPIRIATFVEKVMNYIFPRQYESLYDKRSLKGRKRARYRAKKMLKTERQFANTLLLMQRVFGIRHISLFVVHDAGFPAVYAKYPKNK